MKTNKYTQAELSRVHQEVEAELLKIPGVVGVGFGIKEKAGELTEAIAFRVYVEKKKNAPDIAPNEVIPDEVRGYKTDVLEVPEIALTACEDKDRHNPLIGGISIVSNIEKYLATLPTLTTPDSLNVGTLGCFATINGNKSKDNIVMLSNSHVINANLGEKKDTIFQPRIIGNNLELNNYNPVATINNTGEFGEYNYQYGSEPSNFFFIDCATAQVNTNFSSCCNKNKGIEYKNEINGLNVNGKNTIEGIERVLFTDVFETDGAGNAILNEDGSPKLKNYKVVKAGRKTGRTVGIITDVMGSAKFNSTNYRHIIIIRATENNCEGNMVFSDHGDSGSVIVNEKNRIVGLLFAGGPVTVKGVTFSITCACHIHPVVDRLKITIIGSPAASPTGKRNIAIEEPNPLESTTYLSKEEERQKFEKIKSNLLHTEGGDDLLQIFEKHRPEVVAAINHIRPVTIAWHRHSGPAFVAHFVKSFHEKNYQMPQTVKGISLVQLLKSMKNILQEQGSKALSEVIEKHHEAVIEAAGDCRNFDAFITNLQTQLNEKEKIY